MPPTERPATVRRAWLVASVVLNLFFIALVGGHALRGHRPPDAAINPLARALSAAEDRLSGADADALRTGIRAHASDFAPAEQKMAAARQALMRAIAAPAFDKPQVEQAFEAWQAAWNGFVDTFQPPLIDALAHVSPEGRRTLSDQRPGRARIVP